MADIMHKIEIEASCEQVYQAIIEQEKLSKWWTHQVIAKAEKGSVAEFHFDDNILKFEIKKLSPKQVKWSCLEGYDEWLNTQIVFNIEANEKGTTLRFKHSKWKKATDFFCHCNAKWAYFLFSLKSFLEHGKGGPHPDDMKM